MGRIRHASPYVEPMCLAWIFTPGPARLVEKYPGFGQRGNRPNQRRGG